MVRVEASKLIVCNFRNTEVEDPRKLDILLDFVGSAAWLAASGAHLEFTRNDQSEFLPNPGCDLLGNASGLGLCLCFKADAELLCEPWTWRYGAHVGGIAIQGKSDDVLACWE